MCACRSQRRGFGAGRPAAAGAAQNPASAARFRPQSDVRALVLTPQDRGVIVGRLARAVLSFQDTFLSREASPSGLLCQVRRLAAAAVHCFCLEVGAGSASAGALLHIPADTALLNWPCQPCRSGCQRWPTAMKWC